MNYLGAHVSAAQGVHHVFERGHALGCDVIQIFTRNQRQWQPPPLCSEIVDLFSREKKKYNIHYVASHASYLINLASPDDAQWQKSIEALTDEWRRAEKLKLNALVVHPGSHKNSGKEMGIQRIVQALNRAFQTVQPVTTRLLIENTAGQGDQLGADFKEISTIIQGQNYSDYTGICLDTAHAYEAGYIFSTQREYQIFCEEIEQNIDLASIELFHFNDSKTDQGSRKDRHENIGYGKMGRKPFQNILKDPRFKKIPKILETPGGDEWFRKNLDLLKLLQNS